MNVRYIKTRHNGIICVIVSIEPQLCQKLNKKRRYGVGSSGHLKMPQQIILKLDTLCVLFKILKTAQFKILPK